MGLALLGNIPSIGLSLCGEVARYDVDCHADRSHNSLRFEIGNGRNDVSTLFIFENV